MTTRSPSADWTELVRLIDRERVRVYTRGPMLACATAASPRLQVAIARNRERLHYVCTMAERDEADELVAQASELFDWTPTDARVARRAVVVDASRALPALRRMVCTCDADPAITALRRRAREATA